MDEEPGPGNKEASRDHKDRLRGAYEKKRSSMKIRMSANNVNGRVTEAGTSGGVDSPGGANEMRAEAVFSRGGRATPVEDLANLRAPEGVPCR